MNDSRVIKTTLELSGEGDYTKKLKEVKGAIQGVDSEFKAVNAQFDKNDKSLAALTARYSAHESKLDLQRKALKLIREEYDKVAKADGENSETARRLATEYNRMYAQALKTEGALEKLGKSMKINAEEAEKAEGALGSAAKGEKKLGDAAQEASGKLGKVGKASKEQAEALKTLRTQAERTADRLSTVLTGAAVATVTASAKAYMTFGKEMSNVATLADTTAVSMEDLSDQALKASNDAHIAAENIAQGAYAALSSGIDTANVMRFTTEAAKAAKAGQGELTDVINGATSAMNAWGIASDKSTGVFEKMLVAQDKGKTTLGELSTQIGQITGLAPQLGVSLDEVLAATAALTKNGVQTSSAITGLRAVMSNVIKPTAEAAKAAEALGLDFSAAALKSKGLTGFLQDVLDKTGGSTEELAKLFGSVEGLSQVMLLGGSAAADYEDALNAMANSAGRLDEAFNTVTNNSASKMEAAMNKLKNNAIQFGQTLPPYIDMASGSLEKLSVYISGLSETEQKALLQTALWTAGGLKAVSMLSKMVTTVRMLGAAAGPVGLAAAAIAGITAAIVALNKAADERNLAKTWEEFQDAASANVTGNMAATINATVDTTNAKVAIETAVEELREALTGIDVLSDSERESIMGVINGDVTAIAQALTAAGLTPEEANSVGDNITLAWDNFKTAVDGIQGISNIDDITTLIGEDYDAVVEALKGFGLSDADAQKVATELQNYQTQVGNALSGFDVFGRDEIITFSKAVSNDKLVLIGMLRRFGLSDAEISSVVDVYNASINSLVAKIPDIFSAIGEKLTDGEADTQAVTDGLKSDIAGLFSEAESKLAGMGTEAEDYAAKLMQLEQETVAWIDGMAGKSTDYVLAHLGELEAIQQRVEEVMADIDAANSALMKEGETSYNLTVAGATVNQDTIAKGVQYAYQGYKLDLQAVEEEAAAQMAEADRAFANGVTDASQHLQAEQAIAAWEAEENARLERAYRDQMSKLLQGVYEAYAEASPEDAEFVKTISEKLNIADALQGALDSMENDPVNTAKAVETIQGIYRQIYGVESESPIAAGADLAEKLYADINTALKEYKPQDSGLIDTVMEIFASDAANPLDIDTTDMEDVFKVAMGNVGGAGVSGIVEGMADPDGKIDAAAESLAADTATSAGAAFGSTKNAASFKDVGKSIVQHIIDGLGAKEGELDQKIAAMAAKAAAAAVSASALIAGVNSRVNAANQYASGGTSSAAGNASASGVGISSTKNTTVNVSYSGAYTKREAQRFGTALANQISSELAGKGG